MGATLWKVYSIEMYKNNTICKNWYVVMCFYNNISILLYVLKWQVGVGATAPLAPLNPPLAIIDIYVYTELAIAIYTGYTMTYTLYIRSYIASCMSCM